MNDKEIKELLRHEYPEFDNKGNEIYELVSNKRKSPFFTRKMILMPVASVIIVLLVVFVFTFSGNKGFKKICDGVYVSASTLDLSGEVDMSICEEIVLEEQEIVYYSVEKIHPHHLNIYSYGFVMRLLFFDEDLVFKIYCSNGYIVDLTSVDIGSQEAAIEKREKSVYIQWSPFKSREESDTISTKKIKRVLKQCDDTDLYILCTKNDLIIGVAIIHFDIDIPKDAAYNYCIIGKKEASYVFKDDNKNIKGISEKQLLMIIKQIKKGA